MIPTKPDASNWREDPTDSDWKHTRSLFFFLAIVLGLFIIASIVVFNSVTQEAQPNKDKVIKIK